MAGSKISFYCVTSKRAVLSTNLLLNTWGCCYSGKAARVWSLTSHLWLMLYEIYVKLFLVYYIVSSLLVALWFCSFQQIIAIINYVFPTYHVRCSIQVTLLLAADSFHSIFLKHEWSVESRHALQLRSP